jgi:hypothetical protein|tara:strand:- start:2889 stop:3053 length:165 start_codon:yes stop_codon:yes gene_type:complete
MKRRNYVAKYAGKFNRANIHRDRKKFYKKIKHKVLTASADDVTMDPQSTSKGEN